MSRRTPEVMLAPKRPDDARAPIKVVLTYRVLFHWRVPVFRRLSEVPDFRFVALHGSDFPGTKAVNSKSLDGISHRELWTIKPDIVSNGEAIATPICPALPIHLARERPDVIVCEGGSNFFNNLLVFAYAVPTRTPVVWWTLGELRNRPPRTRTQRVFDAVVRWMERHSAALVGYSSLAIAYFDRMGYAKHRQYRAVNCIDTDRAMAGVQEARARAEQLRDELGLSGKRVLLFVGAMTPAKRLEDLIAVYGRLRKSHSDLRLLLVGDGPHRAFLQTFARSCGAEDAIFTGEVIDGVAGYFALGDLFVLPGLGGLAISEAMVYGLPVIATEADGCELDLIEPSCNGELVASGDLAALEASISRYIGSSDLLRAAGERSRWLIENRFNIGSYMQSVEAAIRFAAGPRRSG